MENLLKEDQSIAPLATPPQKPDRLRLFLFFALGLAILVLVSEGVYWYKLKREKERIPPGLTETQRLAESQPQPKKENLADVSKVSFPCPVPEKYCQEAEVMHNRLMLSLPSEMEVKAVMPGTTSLLKNNFGDLVVELRSPTGMAIFYTFSSDDYLESVPKLVELGDILAKTSPPAQHRPKYNLLLEVVDEAGNYYSNPKEIFSQ